MATFSERSDLASNAVFQQRCRQALIKYVLYMLETGGLTGGALSLGKDVLGAPDVWAQRFAVAASTEPDALGGAAGDPAADTEAGDAALSYAIEMRLWPAFAAE